MGIFIMNLDAHDRCDDFLQDYQSKSAFFIDYTILNQGPLQGEKASLQLCPTWQPYPKISILEHLKAPARGFFSSGLIPFFLWESEKDRIRGSSRRGRFWFLVPEGRGATRGSLNWLPGTRGTATFIVSHSILVECTTCIRKTLNLSII